MQRLHLQKPGWIHGNKPDWHEFGTLLKQVISDPRFWAGVVLVVMFGTLFFLRYG